MILVPELLNSGDFVGDYDGEQWNSGISLYNCECTCTDRIGKLRVASHSAFVAIANRNSLRNNHKIFGIIEEQ